MVCVSCSSSAIKPADESAEALLYVKIESPDFSNLKPLLMSDFVDSIRYIQLQTSPKCFLPKEGGFLTLTEKFIFSGYQGELFKFDKQGNFIRQIARKGRGPGEFEFLRNNYAIDEVNQKIFVKSRFHDIPLSFDFDGNSLGFVRDTLFAPCWHVGSGFCANDGHLIFLSMLVNTKDQELICKDELYLYDYEKKEIVQSLPHRMVAEPGRVHRSSALGLGEQFLGKYCGQHFYKSFYNDTLYAINKGIIQPYAIIDLGSRKYPADLLYSNDPYRIRPGSAGKIQIIYMFVHHQYILFACSKLKDDNRSGADLFICRYDVPTGTVSYHSRYIVNDLDGGTNIFVEFLMEGVAAVTYPLFPGEVLRNQEILFSDLNKSDLKYPEEHDKFIQMQKRRKENDNPLLMTWHLK